MLISFYNYPWCWIYFLDLVHPYHKKRKIQLFSLEETSSEIAFHSTPSTTFHLKPSSCLFEGSWICYLVGYIGSVKGKSRGYISSAPLHRVQCTKRREKESSVGGSKYHTDWWKMHSRGKLEEMIISLCCPIWDNVGHSERYSIV